MMLSVERVTGEVEACLGSRTGAGDVAPLAERALVAEEDVGAVDGGALGGVAGEGVGMGDVPGRVLGVDAAAEACVRLEDQRLAGAL